MADGRKRAVPEALPRVLFLRSQNVLGVLLGLIFVEQRHDLAHHDVHRVVAHLLGDRNELHAVLGELADVELKFEMVAEEAAERMNDHHVKQRGLGRARLDHALELGPAVIGRRCTRLDIGLDELIAARCAIGFALPPLVRDLA